MAEGDEALKARVAALYTRAAPLYGQVGPDYFAFGGRGLVARMGLEPGQRVLDVATGRGANLYPAAERVGPSGVVVGIDLAPGMVEATGAEVARRRLPHVTVQQGDAEALPFAVASFDAALCGFAVFLFPDLERALGEMRRVVRPGGRVGFTVARDADPLSRWYGERITAYAARYGFPLSAGGGDGRDLDALPASLAHAGFTDLRVETGRGEFPYASAQQWWDARWTHGPRYALEQAPPDARARLQAEVFARLAEEATRPGGVCEALDFTYLIATRP